MQHEMRLLSEPFICMYNGKKNIEIRLNDNRRRAVSVGDTILFVNKMLGETIERTVTKITRFNYFAAMDASGIAPAEDMALAREIYINSKNYFKYGIVVFTLAAIAGR